MRAIVIIQMEYGKVQGSEIFLIRDEEDSADVMIEALNRFIEITELPEEEALEYAGGGEFDDLSGGVTYIFWADYVV